MLSYPFDLVRDAAEASCDSGLRDQAALQRSHPPIGRFSRGRVNASEQFVGGNAERFCAGNGKTV